MMKDIAHWSQSNSSFTMPDMNRLFEENSYDITLIFTFRALLNGWSNSDSLKMDSTRDVIAELNVTDTYVSYVETCNFSKNIY